MDKLVTPPTDNLYKFLAIFSIVVIVACVVVNWNYSTRVDERWVSCRLAGLEFSTETENYFLMFENADQFEKASTVIDDPITAIGAEQELVMQRHQHTLDVLRRMSEPRTIEMERQHFQSDANRAHNMQRLLMNEEQYKAWEAKVTDNDLMRMADNRIQLANQLKSKVNQYYALVYEMWDILGREYTLRLVGLCLGAFFLCVALWAFIAWYRRHQKFEDMLIKQRVLAGEGPKANGSSTNGRPAILVAVLPRTGRRQA